MSMTNQLEAYGDCVKILDTAFKSKGGIRISAPSSGDANHLFTRLHYARKLLRDQSMGELPSNHPDWNTSMYDSLIVRRPREIDGEWWVYIEHRLITGVIQELGDADTANR